MCDCVWKTKERQEDAEAQKGVPPQYDKWAAWKGSISAVSWTVTAVKRRHARLSVKLETSEAQLTTKSLIVRSSVHSHSWK